MSAVFFAVRMLATARKEGSVLERYRPMLPGGRHLGDLQKWVDHIAGIETVWYRARA